MAFITIHSYARRFEVGPVLEIIHRRRGSGTLAELHGRRLPRVAGLAAGQLLSSLMGVTIIAFGMAWETGFQLPVVKPVTGVASGSRCTRRHLSLVTVNLMREFF